MSRILRERISAWLKDERKSEDSTESNEKESSPIEYGAEPAITPVGVDSPAKGVSGKMSSMIRKITPSRGSIFSMPTNLNLPTLPSFLSTSPAATPSSTLFDPSMRDAFIASPPNPPVAQTYILQLEKDKMTDTEIAALQKIQKQMRKKMAIKSAIQEHQWKIFTNLDTHDEMEMLHLAVFFQTLLDEVPGIDEYDNVELPDLDSMSDTSSVTSEAIDHSSKKIMNNIQVAAVADGAIGGNHDFTNYDIGKNPLSPKVLEDIIQIYRREGGKISLKLVMKILRQCYQLLKDMGNVSKVTIEKGTKLTVVGDLHGQLRDLLHILDESGPPSDTNKYMFNGDFVDRGNQSVEVMCVVFCMFAMQPTNVFLNRGNHEDISVNRVYGFQNECQEKYDELTYGMFCEVFRCLPLFALVNESILIVHGGLFHQPKVTLADLEAINRYDYVVKLPIPYPDCCKGMNKDERRLEYLKQLQRDALWSDPMTENGLKPNHRGAGVSFGPDVARTFMKTNNISMVIRSHECVRLGFSFPYNKDEDSQRCDDNAPMLCTLFSASNYNASGQNDGAYMVLLPHTVKGMYPIGATGMCYSVYRYKMTTGDEVDLKEQNKSSVMELLMKKKVALKIAFSKCDQTNSGQVTRVEWSQIMQDVTGIKIRWLATLSSIAPAHCYTPKYVDYNLFVDSINVPKNEGGYKIFDKNSEISNEMMDAMYAQRKKLEAIFRFFDTDDSGQISREEFRTGCETINARIPEGGLKLTDIDHTLDLMDFDGSNSIDINEFFETFRILDAADGKVDGVLSLANKN